MAPRLEERVAFLEGKVEEQTRGFGELHDLVDRTDGHVLGLDQKVDRFRDELGSRIDALDQKVDRFRDELSGRIDALDQKVDRFRDELSGRIDALDQKVDRFRDELSGRIEGLDQKVSRQFTWLVGIQAAVLIAVIGSLVQG